ncbi:MAG: Mur ligase domain-containing protein, partial [Mycobacteriales bacterium]
MSAVDRGPSDAGLGRVHFIGIGGLGMSGIARILLARGAAVTGSDAKESAGIEALRALGATVHIGHEAKHVGGAGKGGVGPEDAREETDGTEARGDGTYM